MHRYSEPHAISSALDPLTDLVVLLKYFTAKEYVEEILTTRHGLNLVDARARSKKIIPHMNVALALIQESLKANVPLSFLNSYYGLLDLAKTYILFGPYYNELEAQKWHGASYNVNEKDSRNLLTERIYLKKNGALPLLYRTLTGRQWKPSVLKMSSVYPYIPEIGAEYLLATGSPSRVAPVVIRFVRKEGKYRLTARADSSHESRCYEKAELRVLRGFRQDRDDPELFLGRSFDAIPDVSDESYRRQFNPLFVYSFDDANRVIFTPASKAHLLLPEELPKLFLFFHMSCVVRYKPEFLEKLQSSKFWPMIAAAHRHSVARMLRLAWSFLHRQQLLLTHE